MMFRTLFAFAILFNIDINQKDVKTTFLYSFFHQLIYIKISKSSETEVIKNIVCKLLKILYDLKQFSHI